MRGLLWVIAALTLVGCVPKKQHEAAVADLESRLEATEAERQRLDEALAQTAERSAELKVAVGTLQAHSAALVAQMETLAEALGALIARSAKTAAERDELQASIDALQAGLSDAEGQASAAQKRLEQLAAERDQLEAERARLEAEKQRLEEKTAAYNQLVSSLESEIASGQVTITELSGKLTVNLSNAILFDSGKFTLKAEGRAALEKVAAVLASIDDREIRVEGHTDDDAVRPGAPYADNWALSALRASTVVALLVAQGVDPGNVAALGYGEQHPVASNDTPEGKAANRRTEIVLAPRLGQVSGE